MACWRQHTHDRNTASPYNDADYRRLRRELLDQAGGWCSGAPGHAPHPSADLTVDHIQPVSMGGQHHPTNLRVVCRPWNSGWRARRAQGGRP